MMVKVNNLKENHSRYVVARVVAGELWYWSSWDDKKAAERVASQFDNGVVIDTEAKK